MNKRLSLDEWKNIFRNIEEIRNEEEQDQDFVQGVKDGTYNYTEVEIVWLDGSDEYVLCSDCELFEDGFNTEQQAQERLTYLENELLS